MFVHGLRGGAVRTWRQKDNADGGASQCWPKVSAIHCLIFNNNNIFHLYSAFAHSTTGSNRFTMYYYPSRLYITLKHSQLPGKHTVQAAILQALKH